MKAIVLAGGSGDRLWPLSRRNYPKQFIQFNNEQSLFQNAITRNIPYCDEFIIVASREYEEIIEGQLRQFQSVSYTLCMEEESRGTTVAIKMALECVNDDEPVVVIPADLIINGRTYSNHIYRAKEIALDGRICLFGIVPDSSINSYAYIRHDGEKVLRFMANPTEEMARSLFTQSNVYWNSGMIVALASTLKHEIQNYCGDVLSQGGDIPEDIRNFDQVVLSKSDILSVVEFDCSWIDISDFKSYSESVGTSQENVIVSGCEDVDVINTSSNQLVVVNGIENAYVVNTPDAIYVTDKDRSDRIKDILKKNSSKANKYDRSYIDSRPWGIREILKKEPGFRVRKITIFPGLKLSNHMHNKRNENYTVVSGVLTIELDNEVIELEEGESYNIAPNVMHMIRNNTDENVIVVEVDTGAEIDEWDMVHNDEWSQLERTADSSVLTMPNIYKLEPAYKDYIWGGDRLKNLYGKNTPYDITAESWELSAHQDGSSIIVGGTYDGMEFKEFIDKYKPLVCGWKAEVFDRFPILIKFIDATNALSIQIHPEDDYAFVNENEFGKNEVWYILDCEEDAYLYVGLNRESSVEEIRKKVADKTITDILNKVHVKKGDVIFVPAGTIHAIGAGIFICEIQQNSNSTYRLYDYDRKDRNGNLRKLHLDKAMDVVDTSRFMVNTEGAGEVIKYDRSRQRLLCQCKYFEVKYYDIPKHEIIMIDDSSFKSIVVISGECEIKCADEVQKAKEGDSFFISAGRKRVHIYGQCKLVVTNI
ncbi:MAG: cupin domain-containing protein [Lachnospiraceae bacterium]|nr:cupin domain-containing protein [Lachnospiraceae bacterium]